METTQEKTAKEQGLAVGIELVRCCKCGKIEYVEDTEYIYYDGKFLRVCDICLPSELKYETENTNESLI